MKPNVLALVVAWLGAAVAVGAAVSTRRYIRAVDRTMALAFARLQRERAGRWPRERTTHHDLQEVLAAIQREMPALKRPRDFANW